MQTTTSTINELASELRIEFGKRSAEYDRSGTFVKENYEKLKELGIFSALVPEELGGGGWNYAEMCKFIREIAKGCGSTALALSMHQHLVSANVWKYRQGQGSEEILRKIAANQLILVSTGAGDWLSSGGTMQKTEGGYLVSGRKNFASQSLIGNILVTSARYMDPESGSQVLHFGVPMNSSSVIVEDNWNAMGMRGTGSCSVTLDQVFVPESAITLKRPMSEYHPFWNVVLNVAVPLIMSAYVGIAENAYELSLLQSKKNQEPFTAIQLGELHNHMSNARIIFKDMLEINNNFGFKPTHENGNSMLVRKTILAESCIKVVQKTAEIFGGQSYLNALPVEKLYRDMLAVNFHPLPEKDQQLFTGLYLMDKPYIAY